MASEKKWYILAEIGEGGQGRVYRVLKGSIYGNAFMAFLKTEELMGSEYARHTKESDRFQFFRKAVNVALNMEDPKYCGALKVLHDPQNARDPNLAKSRIKYEIKAMQEVEHPNLLKIIDSNLDSEDQHFIETLDGNPIIIPDSDNIWFISEYHPKGSLIKNRNLFTGNLRAAINAFRPLVEGVSELHQRDLVHRDIKPQNVFVGSNSELILGDFGLVFFADPEHTRISETWGNVGSRDWMPGWAMGRRIEDTKPTFDVFCLGKLLWAMISKNPILPLWYFDYEEFNLEKMFQDDPYMYMANSLFKKCIVEHEEDCLTNASDLLDEIDKLISLLDIGADQIGDNIARHCKVCGVGFYELIVDRNIHGLADYQFNPMGRNEKSYKFFKCNHCGHVQLFSFHGEKDPPAWTD